MENVNLPDLGFDWNEVIVMLKTTGIEFAINLVTAIAIFTARLIPSSATTASKSTVRSIWDQRFGDTIPSSMRI